MTNQLNKGRGKAVRRLGATALAAGALGVIVIAGAHGASATPEPTPLCTSLAPGQASGWCDLTAPGKTPGDSRAQGSVAFSSDGKTLVVSTQDNSQGSSTMGAAPAESQACIYPAPEAPREQRLDDANSCGAVGGTLVNWSGTNSSGSIAVPPSLVGGTFYVYVAAHPDSNNSHGTPFHWTWECTGPPTEVPLGTIGGVGAALLAGGALALGQLRRRRNQHRTAGG